MKVYFKHAFKVHYYFRKFQMYFCCNQCMHYCVDECEQDEFVMRMLTVMKAMDTLKGLSTREAGRGALEKGRVLFLVTTSTLPSLQAYAELHALYPLRGSISP